MKSGTLYFSWSTRTLFAITDWVLIVMRLLVVRLFVMLAVVMVAVVVVTIVMMMVLLGIVIVERIESMLAGGIGCIDFDGIPLSMP